MQDHQTNCSMQVKMCDTRASAEIDGHVLSMTAAVSVNFKAKP